jgi:glucosylceramidase
VLPALTNNSLSTKVLVWDHNWDGTSYPQTVLADTTIQNSDQVAGVAWHGYGGTPGGMTTLHNDHPSKGQYMTEHSGGTWVGNQVQSDFEEIIHTMRNWAKAYVKWSLALDENLGPHSGGCGTCTPLVTVHSVSGVVTYPIEYYTMGMFSKYIRPGATRIYTNNAPGLVNAAFLNADGSKVLVVYNETTAVRNFNVQWGDQVFAYSLPSKAGATFTWNGTQSAGSYALDARSQIQASSYTSVMGLATEMTSDVEGGYNLGYGNNGDVASFKNVDFGAGGLTSVDVRLAFKGRDRSVRGIDRIPPG